VVSSRSSHVCLFRSRGSAVNVRATVRICNSRRPLDIATTWPKLEWLRLRLVAKDLVRSSIGRVQSQKRHREGTASTAVSVTIESYFRQTLPYALSLVGNDILSDIRDPGRSKEDSQPACNPLFGDYNPHFPGDSPL
jgi:hypothetical protein